MKIIVLIISLFTLTSCVTSEYRTPPEPQIVTLDLTIGVTTENYVTNIINVDSITSVGNMSMHTVSLHPSNVVVYLNITRNGITSRIVKDLRQLRFRSYMQFTFFNGILSNISVH